MRYYLRGAMPLSQFLGANAPSLPIAPTATIWDTVRPIGWIGTIKPGVPSMALSGSLAELFDKCGAKSFIKRGEVTIYIDGCDSGAMGALLNEQ